MLKRFLVDDVAMISTGETLCNPTLLEQRLLCAGEIGFDEGENQGGGRMVAWRGREERGRMVAWRGREERGRMVAWRGREGRGR
jgi:hypothetical protein